MSGAAWLGVVAVTLAACVVTVDLRGEGEPDRDAEPGPTLQCGVAASRLHCQGTLLAENAPVALIADLQDCNGWDYGINGIAAAETDASGTVGFAVDLSRMERFDLGGLPPECMGVHTMMVAYWDGHAVTTAEVALTYDSGGE